MSEQQTCPSRIREHGPWERKEGIDQWKTDRWTTDHELAEKKRQDFLSRNPGGGCDPNADEWLWSWGPPRTCSFCGSVHPIDALRLLEDGWEIEFAKVYKAYLNPPGTKTKYQAFMTSIRSREPGKAVPSIWSPTPPVKLYIAHCTQEQIESLNAFLRRAEQNRPSLSARLGPGHG